MKNFGGGVLGVNIWDILVKKLKESKTNCQMVLQAKPCFYVPEAKAAICKHLIHNPNGTG